VSQLLFYLQMKEENEQQKKDSTKCLILHNKEKACTKNDIFFYEISMKTKSSAKAGNYSSYLIENVQFLQ
jgi:hypothetical protein